MRPLQKDLPNPDGKVAAKPDILRSIDNTLGRVLPVAPKHLDPAR